MAKMDNGLTPRKILSLHAIHAWYSICDSMIDAGIRPPGLDMHTTNAWSQDIYVHIYGTPRSTVIAEKHSVISGIFGVRLHSPGLVRSS